MGINMKENLRNHLGGKGLIWVVLQMISALVFALSEYLVAVSIIIVLFAMNLIERSMLPHWLPNLITGLSIWMVWALLLLVALARAGSQLLTRHSGHVLLEYVRARLKMVEAYRLLILEKESSLFLSRLNTFMAQIIPSASNYIFASTGIISASLQTMILAGGMIFLAWKETVVGFICLGISAVIIALLNKKLRETGAGIPVQYRNLEKILVRISRNWLHIRVLNMNKREYERYLHTVREYYKTSRDSFLVKNLAATMPPLMGIAALSVILTSSIGIFRTHPLQIVAFVYLFIRFTQGLVHITDLISTLSIHRSQFYQSSKMLSSLTEEELKSAFSPSDNLSMFNPIMQQPRWDDISGQVTDEETPLPDIHLEKITFVWPGMKQPLIQNLSMDIGAGERFGIVGPNGCGKSTLLAIILGMIIPETGIVRIGGRDPHQFIKGTGSIGFVGEDPFLFEGTIRENLTYGSKCEIPDEDLKNMLIRVGVWKALEKTGSYLDYRITENREGLSAGEQQKVSLARALLRSPGLLILDEASSNIDAVSELEISRILEGLANSCTMLIVSHKPGILKAAERIINLETGEQEQV